MRQSERPRFDHSVDLTEWSIIQAASRRLPSIKYALGVVAISAAAALVFAFTARIPKFPLVIIGVCALMILLVIFAVISRASTRIAVGPAVLLVWSIAILFVLFIAAALSAIATSQPCNLARELGVVDNKICFPRVSGEVGDTASVRSRHVASRVPVPTSAAPRSEEGPDGGSSASVGQPSARPALAPSATRQARYAYLDAATGAAVEVVVGPADDDVRNGILSALEAHILHEGDRLPTKRLTIGPIMVRMGDSGISAQCVNSQTVELGYSIRPLATPSQSDLRFSRGEVCVERQPEVSVGRQAAIRQAVADLRAHLASE